MDAAPGFRWYFAYGSNMDPARLFTERMAGHGVAHGRRIAAALPGWRLAFNKPWRRFEGAGAANIVPAPGETVHGTLNELPEAGFEVLDIYEGVAGGHYARRAVEVTSGDGCRTTAITYVSDYRLTEGLRPACAYLAHLLAGRDLLPPRYHAALARLPCVEGIVEAPREP